MQRKLECRHLLGQRFCSIVSVGKNVNREDQVSQSRLFDEDDYFGVSIPEENWSLPRSCGLSSDELFTKYQADRLSDLEKDNMQFVNMPFGTVRFDNVTDVKHQKETREKFHDSSRNRAGLKENISNNMARVSTSGTEKSGENYYVSFLDQFKKDSKERKTSGSQVQLKGPMSWSARETAQVQEYGDANLTVAANNEDSNEIKGDRDGSTDMNCIDQQYFQGDIAPTESDRLTQFNLKTSQKFNSDHVIPELDPDMLFAHTGKDASSENTKKYQEVISSRVETISQKFPKAHPEWSPTPELHKLETSENIRTNSSEKNFIDQQFFGEHFSVEQKLETPDSDNIRTKSSRTKSAERFPDQEIESSHVETVAQRFPQPESVNRTPKLRKLESTDSIGTKSTDINFIDQQFFGEHFSDEQSSMKTSEILDDQDSKSDLNFIDEEYFKEGVSVSARKPIQLSTSDRREFDNEDFVKVFATFSGNENKSKKKKKEDDRNHVDTRFGRLMQGKVMDELEREARWKRSREKPETKEDDVENEMETAYGTVQMLRSDQGRNLEGGAPLRDSKGMKIMKTTVPQLHKMTTLEIVNMITRHILYDSDDIVAIYKPYGLPSHGGPGVAVSVAHLKDQIGQKLRHKQDHLYMVHRLDKETTGVMLLARTLEMAARLSEAFRERRVVKKYWVITKGIPHPQEGIIDIPMMEGTVDGKNRMALKPNFLPDGRIASKSSIKTFKAETHYRVIASHENTAIVECLPLTGVRHQLRAQLSFGLNTPILGDHKYSNLLRFAPQKLDGNTLRMLGVQQSKVRHIPLHLHAMSILIPEFLNGRNLFVTSNLPKHFCRNMRNLKLNPRGNRR